MNTHATETLPRVLLTGFDPFGGESVNPSWEAVRRLDGRIVDGHLLVAEQLPTCFGLSLRRLRAALKRHAPVLTLCVGQAGGRANLSLERVAINVDDARIADNAGARPIDTPIVRGGPAAYFTTLPIKAQLHALQAAGLPAEISQTAGTFVCNHVFYGLMRALRTTPQRRGGFVHIPFLPEQAQRHGEGVPCLALEQTVRGLQLIVETALSTRRDIALGAGATH